MKAKLPFKEEIFNKDFPEVHYCIGIIAANGHISYRPPGEAKFKIDVRQERKFLLDDLKKVLDLKTRIYQAKGRGSVSLVFRSNAIARTLAKYGILPRSHVSGGLVKIKTSPDFWLGVFEAKANFYRNGVTICERDFLILPLLDFLSEFFPGLIFSIEPGRSSTRLVFANINWDMLQKILYKTT